MPLLSSLLDFFWCEIFLVRCELPDDRTDSFLGAMKDHVTPETQLAVIVLPTNRKDRYDAIKKFCCVDHPGELPLTTDCTVGHLTQMLSDTVKTSHI